MGQLVTVEEKPSADRGIVRFELNRSLTGMGHEHFNSPDEAVGSRPPAELARRLFATGQVDAVHVYSNVVTAEITPGGNPDELPGVIRTLYRYWQPGMKPPAFEDLQPAAEEAAPSGGDAGAGEGADAALSAAAQRVPDHLLERSRAGRERWKARAGG